jgi:uncharacterized protein YyaL (SSP411 family)
LIAAAKRFIDGYRRSQDWRQLPAETRSQFQRDQDRKLNSDPGIDAAVAATADWLVRAQEHSSTADGGVARHYSIVNGWGPSYPETTGYIVPSLIHYSKLTGNAAYLESARGMLDWLVKIQLDDGGFQGGTVRDVPVVPVTFNTGQILMGLAAGASEFGEPYATSMHRAARWLADCMDADGCWRRNQSPFARSGDKTYETHTAWGLLEASRSSVEKSYADAALRNIGWALSKQLDNGWFSECCLTDPNHPLTHTLGYALRGIIEGFHFSSDQRLLDAACRAADGLLSTAQDDGFIPGRLDRNWNGVTTWVCLTGSVQIAHCWLQLYVDTKNERYLDAARSVNRYVRRTVDMDGEDGIRGGIRGSFPIFGHYGQHQFLNWAAKFFVDSNLLEKSVVGTER